MFCIVSFTLLLLPPSAFSLQYELIQHYTPENFFEAFSFFSGANPTGGFVQYVPYATAASTGLVRNTSEGIYLGVDHTNVYAPNGPGRPSVRVESKMAFTEGLFVLDLTHMPTGCGTWPAFWTVGLSDWPMDGEIDIIEAVNDATQNGVALHASGECTVSSSADQTATWKSTDCNTAHDGNQGCASTLMEKYNYGAGFNANGGGIYAMEWTDQIINIWFFSPALVPYDLLSPSSLRPKTSHPDPKNWGMPSASFTGPCSASFGDKFFNHTIVLNTDFCGSWAGKQFGLGKDTWCPLIDGMSAEDSCKQYVASNPQAFEEAYWEISSLRIWQKVPGYANQYYLNENETEYGSWSDEYPSNDVGSDEEIGEDSEKNTPNPKIIDPGIGDGTMPSHQGTTESPKGQTEELLQVVDNLDEDTKTKLLAFAEEIATLAAQSTSQGPEDANSKSGFEKHVANTFEDFWTSLNYEEKAQILGWLVRSTSLLSASTPRKHCTHSVGDMIQLEDVLMKHCGGGAINVPTHTDENADIQ